MSNIQRVDATAASITTAMTTSEANQEVRHEAVSLPGLVDATEMSTDRQFTTNLARGLEVLRAFTPDEPLLGNRELMSRTGLPKATVWRLTYTLTTLGYLNY